MQRDYDRLVLALQKLLPAKKLAFVGRLVGFIRRLRAIRACSFVWAVVLSRLGTGAPGFEQARGWYKRLAGKELWPRPFQVRFKSPTTVALFEKAFEQAVAPFRDPSARRPHHPLASWFPDVVIVDTSLVQLADALREFHRGVSGMAAALKVLLAISLWGLVPVFGRVLSARDNDHNLFAPLEILPRGALVLFDKGFVAYRRLQKIAANGLFFLCPMRINGNALIVGAHRAPAWVRRRLLQQPEGLLLRDLLPATKIISKTWDLDVLLRPQGWSLHPRHRHRLVAVRLVITPGPNGQQRPYLTNLPSNLWTPNAIRELYRLRWQIELVFKELKQHLNLATVPTKDPHAAQVFLWASLVALALSRAVSDWLYPFGSRLAGLAADVRPILVTQALRQTVRIFGRALVAPLHEALVLLRLFTSELLTVAGTLDTAREDSFVRVRRLLPRAAPS